mmetsp:Transcript_88848/g.254002  ORF Transcript_88848/g.254002 Transcript_88848/m.254002 type:complete len:245 (+) Transcript_88848:391-1125(+)
MAATARCRDIEVVAVHSFERSKRRSRATETLVSQKRESTDAREPSSAGDAAAALNELRPLLLSPAVALLVGLPKGLASELAMPREVAVGTIAMAMVLRRKSTRSLPTPGWVPGPTRSGICKLRAVDSGSHNGTRCSRRSKVFHCTSHGPCTKSASRRLIHAEVVRKRWQRPVALIEMRRLRISSRVSVSLSFSLSRDREVDERRFERSLLLFFRSRSLALSPLFLSTFSFSCCCWKKVRAASSS